ncbi:MAG: NAD(P)H-hydrate epimerase [Terracidiphilus sp.]
MGAPESLTGDAAVAWRELSNLKSSRIHVVTNAKALAMHNDALDADLIVDAVLGTGFKPPLKGLALEALEWLRAGRALVLAIDLPSGWPADETSATLAGPVFPADAVITFTAPKPAHLFGQLTRRWDQPVVVTPIGSPEAAMVSALKLEWGGASLSLHSLLAQRRPTKATSVMCW